MKQSKFFELLYSLSEQDRNFFLEFAKLKINGLLEKDVKALAIIHKAILKENPGEKGKNVDEIKIAESIYPNTVHEKTKSNWNHLKNRLLIVLNQYITLIQLKKKSNVKNQLLIEYYQENQLDKNLKSFGKKVSIIHQKKTQDHDLEYYNFKLQEVFLSRKQGKRENAVELQAMSKALDNFYLENKLRVIIEEYNRHRIISSPKPDERLLNFVQSGSTFSNSRIALLHHIYQMMKDPEDTTHYFEIKKLFYQNESNYTKKYKLTIVEYLMNQCIHYCHMDRLAFAGEYIQHIQFLIQQKLFVSERGLIMAWYINSVYMALVSKKLTWAAQFVTKYSTHIDHTETPSIKALNLARVLFHQGKYSEAWQKLQQFNSFDMYFKIIFDKLYIKLAYEECLETHLKSRLAAFEKYIKRKKVKLPPSRQEKNLNFVKAVKNLMSGDSPSAKIQREDLLILDFLWLKEKQNGIQ